MIWCLLRILQLYGKESSQYGRLLIEGTKDAYSKVDCKIHNQVARNVSEPLPVLNFTTNSGVFPVSDYLSDAELGFLRSVMKNSTTDVSYIYFVDVPHSEMSGIVHVRLAPEVKNTLYFLPCTFELGWLPSKLDLDLSSNGSLISSLDIPPPKKLHLRQAKADREWLATVNPFLEQMNSPVFTHLAANVAGYQIPAGIMSILLTVALSNTSPNPGACNVIYQKLGYIGNCDRSQGSAKSWPLHYPVKIFVSSFGYGPNILAVRISLVILFLYCAVVIAHIIYSIWTGIHSSAWDSISEMIALAINSRPAEELQNTCAGIETTNVYEHRVRIAPTEGQKSGERHLELLFPSSGVSSSAKIELNETYGTLKRVSRRQDTKQRDQRSA